MFSPELPIDAVADALKQTLQDNHEAILQAEPGAGKSTRVPLYLKDEPWLKGQKIIMLEPRRLAARACAQRMADTLGETVGETIGYRVRLDTKVSKHTQIEVVTEGILTRMLQADPALEGVGAVIFDEFHERSIDADLALALLLQSRSLLREDDPLKILIMSATLEQNPLTELLNAPVIQCSGRSFPVQVRYQPTLDVAQSVAQALETHTGSLLVFLPGEREIREVQRTLKNLPKDTVVTPLFGNLDLKAQQAAIKPVPKGERKIVLATSIAETSLTIDGIEVVIDSGLSRQPAFDPRTGMTRLATTKVSKAASTQRQGRAGRTGPGHCYRLWSKEAQDRLMEFAPPEILQADLTPLALQLLAWGVSDPLELKWLDPPPKAAWQQAIDTLSLLGAHIDGSLTEFGKRMAKVPSHPRVAHLLLKGEELGRGLVACELAALMNERDSFGVTGAHIGERLEAAKQRKSKSFLQSTAQFKRHINSASTQANDIDIIGLLIASAWPDRIAKRRRPNSHDYQLANGRAARLREGDPLQAHEWLAVCEVGGAKGQRQDTIYWAAPLSSEYLHKLPMTVEDRVIWDEKADRLVSEKRRRIGQLAVHNQQLETPPDHLRHQAIFRRIRDKGLAILNDSERAQRLIDRVKLMHAIEPEAWPDFSEAALLGALEDWLSPWLQGVTTGRDLSKVDLAAALDALLPWERRQQLDHQLPERITLPSGSSAAVDYSESPPVLAGKLQEFFGLEISPSLANGRIKLQIHLLSPAGRPLAMTQDLAYFWRNAYPEVRKENRGRYAKHPWPEDPLSAMPTRFTKQKLAEKP